MNCKNQRVGEKGLVGDYLRGRMVSPSIMSTLCLPARNANCCEMRVYYDIDYSSFLPIWWNPKALGCPVKRELYPCIPILTRNTETNRKAHLIPKLSSCFFVYFGSCKERIKSVGVSCKALRRILYSS